VSRLNACSSEQRPDEKSHRRLAPFKKKANPPIESPQPAPPPTDPDSFGGSFRQEPGDAIMESVTNIANDEALVEEGYERVKSDLDALAPEALIPVNLDVQVAVTTILGALPEIRGLRDRMVRELPAFDVKGFDKLEDYAQALAFAQSKFQFAAQPAGDVDAVSTEASRLREKLVANAQALALSGLFDGNCLEQLKGGNGYKNVAQDLQALSTAMRENWANIQGKSPLTADDVQAASRIALRLTRVVGLREQGPVLLAAATELRLRAFTLLFQTYEEARAAVGYLRRREDDADLIAPSLYPGKGRRRPVDPPPTATPPAPAPTPPAPVPAAASTPATAPASKEHAATQPTTTSNGDPFL
jgi:hypothetical protein